MSQIPPPPPPSRPMPFDQDDEPEPERQTVRIITYRDAIHIQRDIARQQAAWRLFWRTIIVTALIMGAGVVGWWAYTEWFRGDVIAPYEDPEPPLVPRSSLP